MDSRSSAATVKRYLPHSVVATFLVAVVPMLAVAWLERTGHVTSTPLSILLAMSLSLGTATLGSAVWVRLTWSNDLLFRDLMLWGLLQRIRTERLVNKATTLRAGRGRGASLDLRLLEKLSHALEARDPYTHGHSRRVARHAHMMAKLMGLDAKQVAMIRAAGVVHDVGKLDLAPEILNKPGKLTDEEFALVKRHPEVGAEMVSGLGSPELTAIVRHHHERLDGAGYPDRLSADQIPLGSRIIAVADPFGAISSSRP
jgi:HD-GYP domain-containing protein (c-di-GMP phosphodiesterase class II)